MFEYSGIHRINSTFVGYRFCGKQTIVSSLALGIYFGIRIETSHRLLSSNQWTVDHMFLFSLNRLNTRSVEREHSCKVE